MKIAVVRVLVEDASPYGNPEDALKKLIEADESFKVQSISVRSQK